jgi:hypothetical protein
MAVSFHSVPEVVDAIEKRFGTIVTYEDPQPPPNQAMLFSCDVSSADVRSAINRCLGSYVAAGGIGVFRLDEVDAFFHVVGVGLRRDAGALLRWPPVLDRTVAISARDRNGLELIEELTQRLSAGSRINLSVGTVPTNLLVHHASRISTDNASGREILRRLQRELQVRISWRLFFDEQQAVGALNIHLLD